MQDFIQNFLSVRAVSAFS